MRDTRNRSQGSLMKERGRMQGRRIGLVLSGQNIDRAWMREVLVGETPGMTRERKPSQVANSERSR